MTEIVDGFEQILFQCRAPGWEKIKKMYFIEQNRFFVKEQSVLWEHFLLETALFESVKLSAARQNKNIVLFSFCEDKDAAGLQADEFKICTK